MVNTNQRRNSQPYVPYWGLLLQASLHELCHALFSQLSDVTASWSTSTHRFSASSDPGRWSQFLFVIFLPMIILCPKACGGRQPTAFIRHFQHPQRISHSETSPVFPPSISMWSISHFALSRSNRWQPPEQCFKRKPQACL